MSDPEIPPGSRVLSADEAIEDVRWAMQMRVRRVKMGLCRFSEAVTMDRGLDWFGREIVEQLRLSGILFVKKPPAPPHSTHGRPGQEPST